MEESLEDLAVGRTVDSDDDGEFEAVDYRLLSTFAKKSDYSLPSRGEKDFEPDGTNKQDKSLQASRDAMYAALSVERESSSKNCIRAVWHTDQGMGCLPAKDARGTMFKGLGRTDGNHKTWLLPEEVLFMVERGNLECFYDTKDVSMSLQAAYAECIPHIGLDEFQVYSYLKRAGYLVLRSDHDRAINHTSQIPPNFLSSRFRESLKRILNLLWSSETPKELIDHTRVYRSFTAIYQRLQFVPCHSTPSIGPITKNTPSNTLRLSFDVWKPNANFKKSSPGIPDFRIAVMNSRSHNLFTLDQLGPLFESLRRDPDHESRSQYAKLKIGCRNFVLAVVDMGIISFLNIGDVSFGSEKMYMATEKGTGKRKQHSAANQKHRSPKP